MMANFGELKAQIKRDIVRDVELSTDGNADISDDTISYYVKSAINYYKIKPLYFNEATATLTTVSDQKTLGSSEGFPSDFITDTALVADTDKLTVKRVNLDVMLDREQSVVNVQSDAPDDYTIFNNEIRIYPEPDSVFTLTLYYIKELSELTGDSSTNEWTQDAERLIRARAMGDIYAFRLRDTERARIMYQLADDELTNLMERNGQRNSSGQLNVYRMV